jgi:putative ATP-dependent endonuclease of OLD family
LIGDNNTGKSTVLEGLDLVLGPDRLSRLSPIDEHDFYCGVYLAPNEEPSPPKGGSDKGQSQQGKEPEGDSEPTPAPRIVVTATVTELSEEQQAHFGAYIEWWDNSTQTLYEEPNPAGLDSSAAIPALRVTFIGRYDPDEDDFEGKTYYARTLDENENPEPFTKRFRLGAGGPAKGRAGLPRRRALEAYR